MKGELQPPNLIPQSKDLNEKQLRSAWYCKKVGRQHRPAPLVCLQVDQTWRALPASGDRSSLSQLQTAGMAWSTTLKSVHQAAAAPVKDAMLATR